jgi:gamma-glutamylcyclotransferase (GGCT)/AIG2-like uncharacterized protein YtfP
VSTADAGISLFVYGTLVLPEVMEAVAGRAFASRPAELPGFAPVRRRNPGFPGHAPRPGATTSGRLCEGVGWAALELLDDFEGDLYERLRLPVRPSGGAAEEAHVYVIRPEHRDLLTPEPWDPQYFAERHLSAYLAGCRRRGAARRPAGERA